MSFQLPIIAFFSIYENISGKQLVYAITYPIIAAGVFSIGYYITSYYSRLKTGPIPYDTKISEDIEQIPLFQQLRSSKEWIGTCPHLFLPDHEHKTSVGVLSGPGKVSVPQWVFWRGRKNGEEDQKCGESCSIGYLGDQISAYEGIVHGGVI
ncbi:hypothetical protein NEOLI_005499, partial [Neolecta irregularis DAH-3]